MKNGDGRRIATHDEQIKTLFKSVDEVNKRFNEEIGMIQNDLKNVKTILKGEGEDTGLVGKVDKIHDKMIDSDKKTAIWVGVAVSAVLIIFQYVLPRILGG